jgi:N-acetylglucosaminyldiphosphoundecaprenol N-acetyl-beta-D-mannosaminyltransferase
MEILRVRVDNLSHQGILEKIESFLSDGKFHQIATVNAEFILQAQKDAEFKNILNESDLNVADSISVKFAFMRFGKWLKCRMAGADLMHEILRIANEKKLAVFLAANKNGLSSYEEVCDALSKVYPNIEFFGDNIDPLDLSYKLEARSYKLILCGFGSPFQEKFINSLKNDLSSHLSAEQGNNLENNTSKLTLQNERCGGIIGVAMGLGGSFDFATGKIKRAPKIMRSLGLEWLWRFVQEPKYRTKRIIKAVIIFPLKVIFSRK